MNNVPIIGWTNPSGAHVNQSTFQGVLEDLEGGHALTQVYDPNGSSSSTLLLDGNIVATINNQLPPVLEGTNVAWIDGESVLVNGQQVGTGTQLLVPLAASPNHLAWIDEPQGGCNIVVDGIVVAQACPDTLKLVENANSLYVGWSDIESANIYVTQDGATWQKVWSVSGSGVLGLDFVVGSNGSLLAAWTQYDVENDGSQVWRWNGGDPVLVSGPVASGLSGAGNPVVTVDGSIAYLDDSHGTVAGHFDIWLDGMDITNQDDGIDQLQMALQDDGTRVLAWSDEVNVWTESFPN